jgi:rubrerythrin
MIDWSIALSTASQAIKFVNELRSIDKEMSQAELKLKVTDLTNALVDLKMTLTEARSDAAEKDAEISRLKALQRRVTEETVELHGYRYRKRKDGKRPAAGNPFCDVCFQKEGFLIETTDAVQNGIYSPLQCPNCKAWYGNIERYAD